MSIHWKSVNGWEGFYEVSSDGQVRSVTRLIKQDGRWGVYERTMRGKVLKPFLCSSGYLFVRLSRPGENQKSCLIHRLVAIAFLGQPEPGQEVCHANGVRVDNKLANLRWGTRSENHSDKILHGTSARGEKNPSSKLTRSDVECIRSSTERLKVLAERFGVSEATVCNIRKGKSWKWISPMNRPTLPISEAPRLK